MVIKMKRNWWKLGVATGMVLAVMAGNGRLDVSAAGKKAEEGVTARESKGVKTARHIPIDVSMKTALGAEDGGWECGRKRRIRRRSVEGRCQRR